MSGETRGTLLGGRVSYRQLRDGHRTGIEPVLLAASIPARGGDRVAEGGIGAGAGLLCLGARVAGIEGWGIEADEALVRLARENFAANGVNAAVLHDRLPALAHALPVLDHAFANPPWFAAEATASPDPGRRLARQVAGPGLLHGWALTLGRTLRPGGTLTFVVPGNAFGPAAEALAGAGCGGIVLHPLWPRRGGDAKIAIMRGIKGSRSPARIAPGLWLHAEPPACGYTPEADAILRGGAPLPI